MGQAHVLPQSGISTLTGGHGRAFCAVVRKADKSGRGSLDQCWSEVLCGMVILMPTDKLSSIQASQKKDAESMG